MSQEILDGIRDLLPGIRERADETERLREVPEQSVKEIEETGFSHQSPMPEVAGPEGLASELDRTRERAHLIPAPLRAKLTRERTIEIRVVDPIEPLSRERRAPVRYAWFRTTGPMPDDLRVHQYLLAYVADFSFLTTALQPHGVHVFDSSMQVASLDHAMWFHRPFRCDDWLLYAIDSPTASGARGLVRGQWFTRDGTLVASTVQEGLIRWRGDGPPGASAT